MVYSKNNSGKGKLSPIRDTPPEPGARMKTLLKQIRYHGTIVCIGIYLTVCFIFGYIYCYIANETNGQAFVFQEDILLQTKNTGFQKEMELHINYNITRELFVNYDKSFILMKLNRNDSPFITFNLTSTGVKPIGASWANYYIAKWKSLGYNYCSAEILERHQNVLNNTSYTKILFRIYNIPPDIIINRSANEPTYLSEVYSGAIKKQQEFYVWIDESEFGELSEEWRFTGNDSKFASLDYAKYFLSNSSNYFDNAIDIIYKYETQSYLKYPLLDFLYFSAVTITTLGYGDILPNSSMVRGLVMMESILGAIMLAISISFLYDRIKTRS